jgi:hypothetical protein
MSGKPFILTVVVWGREFIHKFLHYALPTFLAPGNIPRIVDRRKCEFLIVTSFVDKRIIEQDSIFKMLTDFISVEFVVLDFEGMKQLPHLKMSLGHRVACDYAVIRDAYCVFLGPDYLLSDGTLAYLDQRAAAGARAVLLPGFRLIEEEVREVITRKYVNTETFSMAINPRDMVNLIFSHVHPEMKSYMVDSDSFSYCPNYVVWPLRSHDSLFVHAFHLHPLLLDLSGADDLSALDRDTIDGDFVGRVIDDWDDIEIIRDSDQALVVSLTPRQEGPSVVGGNLPDPANVGSWAYSAVMTPLHRYYFTKSIVFHSGPPPSRSDLPLGETARFVYEALKGPSLERWDNIGAVVKSLCRLAIRHFRNLLRHQAQRLRYIASALVNIPKYGVQRGRLIEHYDSEISLLLRENTALRERLGTLTMANLEHGREEFSGVASQSDEVHLPNQGLHSPT